jgi:predicted metalloprotease
MKWRGRRQSSNVEDRRGRGPGKKVGGGIGALVIIVLVWILGGDPGQVLNLLQVEGQSSGVNYQVDQQQDELAQFVAVVLADAEDVWETLFRQSGSTYRKPKLVLYDDAVQSACGFSQAATGPFYCPGDEKMYIDLDFYRELRDRFQAPGDFAMAYVIAHEVGHHVQKLTGVTNKVMSMHGQVSQTEFNRYMVRLELQADFYAGVWAHHAQRMKNMLEEGDIEEAMNAASAVGDDRIQKRSQGYVVPDAFTHGTSEQRVRWFAKGFKSGNVNEGDTFNAARL